MIGKVAIQWYVRSTCRTPSISTVQCHIYYGNNIKLQYIQFVPYSLPLYASITSAMTLKHGSIRIETRLLYSPRQQTIGWASCIVWKNRKLLNCTISRSEQNVRNDKIQHIVKGRTVSWRSAGSQVGKHIILQSLCKNLEQSSMILHYHPGIIADLHPMLEFTHE